MEGTENYKVIDRNPSIPFLDIEHKYLITLFKDRSCQSKCLKVRSKVLTVVAHACNPNS
jgi:hypothetical protein